MTKLEQAARQALEALVDHGTAYLHHEVHYSEAITALREALAEQAEQSQLADASLEPVAWMCSDSKLLGMGYSRFSECCAGVWNIPVYAAPVRTKDLTDDEINELWLTHGQGQMMYIHEKFARAVIAADREKNK